jgi:hypothetical protein
MSRDEWHTLNRLADAVAALQSKQLTLGAPIKTDLTGDAKTQAEVVESMFSDYDVENGSSGPGIISSDYMQSITRLVGDVKKYWEDMMLDSNFYYQCRRTSQVIQITAGWNDTVGWPTVVLQRTRPCAEAQGFYEFVLWRLKKIILSNPAFAGLIIEEVAADEANFYTDKGFSTVDKGRLGKRNPNTSSDFSNPHWITREELLKATKEKWKVKTTGEFPSASELMTPAEAKR